jgi:hypothetical protein
MFKKRASSLRQVKKRKRRREDPQFSLLAVLVVDCGTPTRRHILALLMGNTHVLLNRERKSNF